MLLKQHNIYHITNTVYEQHMGVLVLTLALRIISSFHIFFILHICKQGFSYHSFHLS
jgi:hypothetical protein